MNWDTKIDTFVMHFVWTRNFVFAALGYFFKTTFLWNRKVLIEILKVWLVCLYYFFYKSTLLRVFFTNLCKFIQIQDQNLYIPKNLSFFYLTLQKNHYSELQPNLLIELYRKFIFTKNQPKTFNPALTFELPVTHKNTALILFFSTKKIFLQ